MKKELRWGLDGVGADGRRRSVTSDDCSGRKKILDGFLAMLLKQGKTVEGRGVVQEEG